MVNSKRDFLRAYSRMKGSEITIIWIFVIASIVIAVCDARARIIPNRIVLPLFALGWIYSWQKGMLKESLIAFVILGGFSFIAWLFGGSGGGDVKLMAAVGVWAGYASFFIVTIAALIGTVWGVFQLFRQKAFGAWIRSLFGKKDSKEIPGAYVPFGTCIGLTVAGLVWFML